MFWISISSLRIWLTEQCCIDAGDFIDSATKFVAYHYLWKALGLQSIHSLTLDIDYLSADDDDL